MEGFEAHLKTRSDDIRDIISHLPSKSADVSPDMADLQSQLAKKLAEEKVTIANLEKALADKQQAEESLEAASLRYMVAEKKLDRARSVTVAKLEKQYILGGSRPNTEASQAKREESSPANGGTPVGDRSAELEETNTRLTVVSEKQKEQLQKLEAENTTLLSQLNEQKIKVVSEFPATQVDLFELPLTKYF
jgi:E3 ubiquitin-protein ligase BRE1